MLLEKAREMNTFNLNFGSIDFLLRYDFAISKHPISPSAFQQKVLHYWKLINKHNFTSAQSKYGITEAL